MHDIVTNRSTLTNLVLNQFMRKNNIHPRDYNFKPFVDEYLHKNHIELVSLCNVIDEDFLLAMTVHSKDSTAIFLNQGIRVESRRNFSLCHEISHCLFDINHSNKNQHYFNVENNASMYTVEEQKMEYLADTSAGIIMLPDSTIIESIKENERFIDLLNRTQMSKAALWTRLVQFCEIVLEMNSELAIKLINRYRYKSINTLLECATNAFVLEKMNEIIYDFNNSLKY